MKRLFLFLRSQIADMGLLGFLFMCIFILASSPLLIIALIGECLVSFNEKTMEWFGGNNEE